MAVPKATSAGKGRNTPTTTTTTRWEGKVANDDDDDDDDDDCVVFPTTKHATGGRKNAKANDAPAADVVVVTHVELFDAIESSVTTPAPLLRLFHPPSRRNDRRRAVDDSLHDDEDDDGRLGNGNDDDKEEEVEEEVAEEDGIANVLATRPTTNQRREMILDVVRSSTFSRKRARRLFGGMTMALSRIVGDGYCLPPHPRVRAINDEDDDDGMDGEDDNMAEEAEAEAEEAVRFLGCCASLVEAYLRGMLIRQGDKRQKQQQPRASLSSSSSSSSTRQTKPIEVVDEAFEVGGTLHDLLFPLQQGRHRSSSSRWSRYASRAQSSIFSMCELWWHGNFIDRERMVTQLVPLLLVRCLDANARRDDVRRLCSVRTAIDLLDFDDSSISSLKVHLLRTVGNPLFLRCNEGRKFVGHMLLVDASFVAEVHDAVKAQIPGAKKSVLEAYAEIYYGAWKASTEMIADDDDDHDDRRHDREGMEDEVGEGGERRRIVAAAMGDIQSSIEENALQDLMYHSMHASSSATAKSARAVLDRFHVNKKAHDVESMLHRTYGPLLWRGLTSANARVRVRSCAVLADTFPLRDPRAGEGSTEAVVVRSTGALVMSMKDEVPCVRVAGSVATARILGCFWAMIPISDIRTLLDQIVAVHVSDASSSAVRAAAVNAIATLLENGRTHALLRQLLPSIGNLIHDKSDKVRLAVVNLLLLVKEIRGIRYYHVVPANHLLARLADEGCERNNPRGPVARALSNLLSNDFFPTGSRTTMTDIVNRTMRLLTDSPQAWAVFYRNASSQLSVNSISKLIAALAKCLCYFVIEEKRTNQEDVSGMLLAMPEVGSIQCKGGHSSTAMMATIAEGISILWESIEAELMKSENERAHESLVCVFSGHVLTELYLHFVSKFDDMELGDDEYADCSRAVVAILNCAGKLIEGRCEQLRPHVIDQLRKMSNLAMKQRVNADLSPNFALLCQWGMMEDVVQWIASSIRHHFEGNASEPSNSFAKRISNSSRPKRRGNNADIKNLPMLDIEVCLGVLGHMLKGSHLASASLRESILTSESAFQAISSALQTSMSAIERIMIARASNIDLRVMRHLGTSIECYGRLLIHKRSMQDDVPLQLTAELKSLIQWLTFAVAPSLVNLVDQDNTLRNLDVSGIMSVGSPKSAPDPAGILDDSPFMDERKCLNVLEDKSKFLSTRAAVICCASSVIRIFSEWLSIRSVGDIFITERMSEMCKLLECLDRTIREALLPLLLHTAVVCLSIDGDASLFEGILISMKTADLSQEEGDIISHSMSVVLAQRDEQHLGAAISAIVRVVRTIVVNANDIDDTCTTEMSFIEKVGVFMGKVLGHILSEKRSSLLLAQFIIDKTKVGAVREFLFEQLNERSPKTDALKELLLRWELENVSKHDPNEDKENSHINHISNENQYVLSS